MAKYLLLIGLFLFVAPRPVHAYIDPGTGSYLFQFLIAGLLGSVYFFRGYLAKIKDFFFKSKRGRDEKKH